jgi:hypothetical protein
MGAWGTSARQIADWWQSSGNAKIVEVAMEENLSEVKV